VTCCLDFLTIPFCPGVPCRLGTGTDEEDAACRSWRGRTFTGTRPLKPAFGSGATGDASNRRVAAMLTTLRTVTQA
jgi:hypothetical protein